MLLYSLFESKNLRLQSILTILWRLGADGLKISFCYFCSRAILGCVIFSVKKIYSKYNKTNFCALVKLRDFHGFKTAEFDPNKISGALETPQLNVLRRLINQILKIFDEIVFQNFNRCGSIKRLFLFRVIITPKDRR